MIYARELMNLHTYFGMKPVLNITISVKPKLTFISIEIILERNFVRKCIVCSVQYLLEIYILFHINRIGTVVVEFRSAFPVREQHMQ